LVGGKKLNLGRKKSTAYARINNPINKKNVLRIYFAAKVQTYLLLGDVVNAVLI
jgi:hypothetical protein